MKYSASEANYREIVFMETNYLAEKQIWNQIGMSMARRGVLRLSWEDSFRFCQERRPWDVWRGRLAG